MCDHIDVLIQVVQQNEINACKKMWHVIIYTIIIKQDNYIRVTWYMVMIIYVKNVERYTYK